jgi:hypothetical protein
MKKTIELDSKDVNYIVHVLEMRGNVLMNRTSSQSEHELGRIDALIDKILLQCVTEKA